MRSQTELTRCSVVLAVLLCACRNHDERVTLTCDRVRSCGGGEIDCRESIADALQDGRISPDRASACAVCAERNDCCEIQIQRHCDAACDGLGVIADMYTTPALRLAACAAPLKLCSLTDAGASADAPDPYRYCRGDQEDARKQSVHNPCVNQVELAIQTAPKLDRSLALCSSCLLLEVNTLREKGEKATPLSSCRPEVCAEACAHFPTFATQLRELSSATSLCAWIEQCGPVSGYDGGTGECAAEVLRTNGAGELVANCLNCVISGGTCESAYGLAAVEADAGISGELSAGCKTVCEGVPSFHGASVAPDI